MDDIGNFQKFANEIYNKISDCGFTKPPSRLSITDKVDVIQSVALHHVILKALGELSQFREGLDTLGIAKAMEQHEVLLQNFFVIKESEVTGGRYNLNSTLLMFTVHPCFLSDYIRKLFKIIRFKEEGSNAHAREQNSYMMFLEYLDECEKGVCTGHNYFEHY